MDRQANKDVAEMSGRVALPRKSGELVFHDNWERRAFAMAVALAESRSGCEGLHCITKLTRPFDVFVVFSSILPDTQNGEIMLCSAAGKCGVMFTNSPERTLHVFEEQ